MKKQIQSVKDLPDWFTPEKYRGSKDFNAAHWLDELRHRRQLLEGNPKFPKSGAGEMEAWRLRIAEAAETLRASPIRRTGPGTAFIIRGRKQPELVTHGAFSSTGPGKAPIRSVTIHDLLSQSMRDKRLIDDPVVAGRWDALGAKPGESFTLSAESAQSMVSLGQNCPLLMVDLSAGDTVLKEYFLDWLASARRASGFSGTRKNSPDYTAWFGYGVLPYIDITIWAMQFETSVTAQVFADFLAELTGDYDHGVDAVRGTTKVWAKRLMLDLSALEAQAMIERDLR
jgi:hypothetical protein